MERITVTITTTERSALVEMAERERRDPREQAAILIRRGLESERFLPAVNLPKQSQSVEEAADGRH